MQPLTPLPLAALAAAALMLSACGSGSSDPPALANPATFAGSWTGTSTRVRGAEADCAAVPFVLTVDRDGASVRGEVRSPRDRTVTTSRFDAVIDPTGRMTARAWYGGAENIITGTFEESRFTGTITSNYGCFSTLRLSRA